MTFAQHFLFAFVVAVAFAVGLILGSWNADQLRREVGRLARLNSTLLRQAVDQQTHIARLLAMQRNLIEEMWLQAPSGATAAPREPRAKVTPAGDTLAG